MTQTTEADALKALAKLAGFISRSQRMAILDACGGEEKQFFFDKVVEIERRISTMPKTFEQEGHGEQALVYLHYFHGNMDWYIIEKDVGTAEEAAQHQAFGLADFGDGGELGYISIAELIECGVELDFYFTPCTLAEVRARKSAIKPR